MKLLELLFGRLKNQGTEISALEANNLFDCIKSMESGASRISAWSLTIIGGTLLVILNKDYSTPETGYWRLIYLLYIFGWLSLGRCLYMGNQITGSTIIAELRRGNTNDLKLILKQCNRWYGNQIKYFNISLYFFGVWLVLYMIWWIFGDGFIGMICKNCKILKTFLWVFNAIMKEIA